MPFFDTHTHLDYLHHDTGEPLAQLVDNAKQADVQKILIVAVKESDFKTPTLLPPQSRFFAHQLA